MNDLKSVTEQIKTICFGLLTLREHSRQELLLKLTAKGYPAELVQVVINELALHDWQSDQRYAENYARQRQQKGFGKLRVRYELRQRGIEAVNLESFTEDQEDEFSLLQRIYLKKYPADTVISGGERAKRFRFLLQRGFSAEMINDLFKHLQLKYI